MNNVYPTITRHLSVVVLGLLLTGCASTPAPIITPMPSTSTAASSGESAWVSAPTPTPEPAISSSTTPTPDTNPSRSPATNPSNSTTNQDNPTSAGLTPQGHIPTKPNTPSALQGLRVVIDPGHNGGNFNATKTIAKQVPDGRGGKKNCNTTGTATANGYRESTFNWAVSQRMKTMLEARGASVVLTRDSDDGVGPCVDERGKSGAKGDVLVSIHANGSTDTSTRGWFVIYAQAPLNAAQDEPSRLLASYVAQALTVQGFPTNPLGPYTPRKDIATINHSTSPVVMVELLEMKNPEEAALAQSPEGQDRYASALVSGLEHWAADPRRH